MTVHVDYGNGASISISHGGEIARVTLTVDGKEKHHSFAGLKPDQILRILLEGIHPSIAKAAIEKWRATPAHRTPKRRSGNAR